MILAFRKPKHLQDRRIRAELDTIIEHGIFFDISKNRVQPEHADLAARSFKILAAGLGSRNADTQIMALKAVERLDANCSGGVDIVTPMRDVFTLQVLGLMYMSKDAEVREKAKGQARTWMKAGRFSGASAEDATVRAGFFYRNSDEKKPIPNTHNLENHPASIWVAGKGKGHIQVHAGCLDGSVRYAAGRWFKADYASSSAGSYNQAYYTHRTETNLPMLMRAVTLLAAHNIGKSRKDAATLVELINSRQSRLKPEWYERHAAELEDLQRASKGKAIMSPARPLKIPSQTEAVAAVGTPEFVLKGA